jgi:RNA-directed DNA polymerase
VADAFDYRPSTKSIKRMVEQIHAVMDRTRTWQETTRLVGKVYRTLRGWVNCFQVGTVSKAYRALDSYTAMRLRPAAAVQAQNQASQGRALAS